VDSTLAKLSLCRTAALGGRRYRCEPCGKECVVYNSCGDRHCPTCGGAKRANWLDSTSQLVLDGVPYFQVVFTIPAELSRLALGNRRAIFNLLFTASWSALKRTIQEEQRFDPAAAMVLHTWNQKLDAHVHVHAVVPGGGPGLDGKGWRWSCRDSRPSSRGEYLVDADRLRSSYREEFLKGLDRLHAQKALKLEGEFERLKDTSEWESFMETLRGVTWVSYIEPPPSDDVDGKTVLKYLVRYLTGGPISDGRIVSADDTQVTFLAREGAKTGGERKQVLVTLSTDEFMRRWCLHILPKGFTKSRFYGGWSNTRRESYLERCSHLLEAIDAPVSDDALEFGPLESVDEPDNPEEAPECPCCGRPMILQERRLKPSWRDVMASTHRPPWYQVPALNATNSSQVDSRSLQSPV